MLGADMLVQPYNSGSFTGTSGSATLPSGVAADSAVILVLTSAGTTLSTPSGFVRDCANPAGLAPVGIYRRDASTGLAAGETSWTITSGGTTTIDWIVLELTGIDPSNPVDVNAATPGSTASGTSVSTGTTAASSTYDGVIIAGHAAYQTTGGVAPTLSGHTNGLEEVAEQGGTDGTKAVGLSVSWRFVQSLGTFSSTATQSGAASAMGGNIVVYTAAGARRAADVLWCGGAEIGSTTGLTATGNALPYLDAVANATVDAAAARTGNFGWRINSSAALGYVRLASTGITLGVPRYIDRFSFRFRTALPGGDRILFEASGWTGRWISASQRIGLKHSTGSEVLSDAAVDQTGVWYSIDRDVNQTVTQYTHDWQITYGDGTTPVAQAQAVSATAQTANIAVDARVGTAITAQTLDMDVDDWVVSKTRGHYPLGDMRVYPLKVDPAGTPAVTGTSTNFQTFTANGTGAAFSGATARGAVDDIPPTIGASADGVMQITAAASDYVSFPAETLDLASIPGSLRGIRACIAGWAASATTATITITAHDGTTEFPIVGQTVTPVDPGWDNAAELWACGMVKLSGTRPTWDQPKLDALALRMGYSNDATPDIGIHAFVFEAAVRMTETQQLFGELASQAGDPDSAGVQTVTVTAPVGGDTSLYYEENTSPTTVPLVAGASTTEVVQAADAPTVNYVALFPPPEGVPDA